MVGLNFRFFIPKVTPLQNFPFFPWLLILFSCQWTLSAEIGLGAEVPDFAEEGVPFLQQHCMGCHHGDEAPAGLSLELFLDNISLIRQRKTWNRVLDMLASGQMPPDDSYPPSAQEREDFSATVKAIFYHFDHNTAPDPGRVTVRRLNKTEYRNTVRDLLGVDFDPSEAFPDDDIGHGFDNIGDVLTLSPLLMERYLDAAEAIAHRVILVDPPPPSKRYRNGRSLEPRNDGIPEGRFRLLDPSAPEPWKSGPFTTDAKYLKFFPNAEIIFRATVYAESVDSSPVEIALFVQGNQLDDFSPPEQVSRLMGPALKPDSKIKILQIFNITSHDPKRNQTVEVRVNRLAGVEKAGIAMVKPADVQGDTSKPAKGRPPAKLQIRSLWTEGPLETRPDTQFKILSCSPNRPQSEQTREVLTRLLRRGFRRPAEPEMLNRLVEMVASVQASGQKWEAGIQQAIKIILCSPQFLFRLELDEQPRNLQPRPIDQFHLASRLSYFLWSTMPDDELFHLAEQGELTNHLETQVRRMLPDPRADELIRNFGFQWLQVQRLATISPDADLFPTFTPKLRADMLKETELFLSSIVKEDRSFLNLLDADYTYLNQSLANHYGIADTKGNWKDQPVVKIGGEKIKGRDFQRVQLQGRARGGILTQASVLTVTSNPTRTSPTKRGRWVLEQILGTPPPPPPPDVPELPDDEHVTNGNSLRQLLEQHRRDPACANCHAKMDPIGFALENYNAVGAYREKDGESEIDAGGQFPDGTAFDGITGLKGILANQKTQFARSFTEKMMTYALGRGIEYYDQPTVENIIRQLETQNYRFSVLITEIVKSDPFRLRRGLGEDRASSTEDAGADL